MSCYFNQFKDLFAEAGIEVNKENKKALDKLIHQLVDVEYKNCSLTRRKLKELVTEKHQQIVAQLKKSQL